MAAFNNFSAEGSTLQKSRTSEGPISALQVSLVPVKRWSWRSRAVWTRVRDGGGIFDLAFAGEEGAVEAFLVAGDGGGGATAVFDGGGVEAAGVSVPIG